MYEQDALDAHARAVPIGGIAGGSEFSRPLRTNGDPKILTIGERIVSSRARKGEEVNDRGRDNRASKPH